MVYLDLFSGIGGFAKGFMEAGAKFTKHYYSEIDKHAIAVYKHRFDETEHLGDIRDISGGSIQRPNIITFGFPCQDLSIAGKKRGLDGKRSGLFFEAVRLVDTFRPEVFIFENVKGLLSNNGGRDFEKVLRTVADLGVYGCEWQLVNTRWLLPQNRERVFFVGHLAGSSKPEVFPFKEGDSRFDHIIEGEENTSWALRARDYHDPSNVVQVNPVITPNRKEKRQNGRRFKDDGEEMFTLTAQDRHGVSITSASKKGYEQAYEGDGITTNYPKSKSKRGRVGRGEAHTLNTYPHQATLQNSIIRKLTETECERLQGFPDNWTKYGDYNGQVKEVASGLRYKLLGNAVTVDMARIIAERLTILKPGYGQP